MVALPDEKGGILPITGHGSGPSPARLLIYCLAGLFIFLLIGCLLWPSLFWDRFIYRYFWGSTEADALGHPVNGITEDYNLISTLGYGALLAAAVYLIYTGFRHRSIRIDLSYMLALIPFVLFGTLTRALEDSFYFSLPMAYVFISPQIYVLVGLIVVGLTLAARRLGRAGTLAVLWAMVPVYLVFFVAGYRGEARSEPALLSSVTLLLLTAVLSLVIWRRDGQKLDPPAFLAYFGLQSISASLFLVAYWSALPGSWGPVKEAGWSLHPVELAVVPALALGAALLVWLLFHYSSRRTRSLAPLAGGTCSLIFFGHFLDAGATFRALDAYGYGEKHVLSNYLIGKAGTAAVMFPMKAVAIGLTLYILEIEFRNDLKKDALLRGLLRAALLVLGLSPGLRDLFRLVMGV